MDLETMDLVDKMDLADLFLEPIFCGKQWI